MRKNWRSRVLVLLLPLLILACSREKESAHTDTYTCPMHPTVVSDRPGTCPVCGMDLVRKARPGEEVEITEDIARVMKSPNEIVNSNIRTVKGEFKAMPLSVDVTGRVTYDTRNVYIIPSRISGRLEKVYLKSAFQPVTKGQKVAEVYSPELLTAQRELLYLVENDADNTSLIEGAKSKLSLLGATPSQIDGIIQSKQPVSTFAIYSPYNGYAVGDNLVRAGNYITAGETIFSLVTTTALRIELDLPVAQAGRIQVNDVIQMDMGDGMKSQAKVDLVQPFLNPGEEFIKVRVITGNNNLQVGQLVAASVVLQLGEALWLPKASVLDLGLDRIVFVKERGSFVPKKVQTGVNAGDSIEILLGISSSDEVAADAHYLVDSESFVKAK